MALGEVVRADVGDLCVELQYLDYCAHDEILGGNLMFHLFLASPPLQPIGNLQTCLFVLLLLFLLLFHLALDVLLSFISLPISIDVVQLLAALIGNNLIGVIFYYIIWQFLRLMNEQQLGLDLFFDFGVLD
jgi:hypothetical protein